MTTVDICIADSPTAPPTTTPKPTLVNPTLVPTLTLAPTPDFDHNVHTFEELLACIYIDGQTINIAASFEFPETITLANVRGLTVTSLDFVELTASHRGTGADNDVGGFFFINVGSEVTFSRLKFSSSTSDCESPPPRARTQTRAADLASVNWYQ